MVGGDPKRCCVCGPPLLSNPILEGGKREVPGIGGSPLCHQVNLPLVFGNMTGRPSFDGVREFYIKRKRNRERHLCGEWENSVGNGVKRTSHFQSSEEGKCDTRDGAGVACSIFCSVFGDGDIVANEHASKPRGIIVMSAKAVGRTKIK